MDVRQEDTGGIYVLYCFRFCRRGSRGSKWCTKNLERGRRRRRRAHPLTRIQTPDVGVMRAFGEYQRRRRPPEAAGDAAAAEGRGGRGRRRDR